MAGKQTRDKGRRGEREAKRLHADRVWRTTNEYNANT